MDASFSRNGPLILAQSAVPQSVTGTLVETTMASIVIPGGIMGANGMLRVQLLLSCVNNANAKTVNIKLGGALVTALGFASNDRAVVEVYVINRNNLAAQSFSASQKVNSQSFTGMSTGAIDTSADRTLTISATLANVADTVTLERYTVEVLPA